MLLVDVEPSQWGDPIHVLRKGYDSVAAGAVFVRHDGRTERATPEDFDNLNERARRAPQQVRLSTTVLSGVPLYPVDQGPKARQSWLTLETERCHASLHSPTPPADEGDHHTSTSSDAPTIADILARIRPYSLGPNTDPRSRDQYLRDVTRYVEQCEKEIPRAVRRAAAIRMSPLALRVTNLTDLNLADVEIQFYIPGTVEAVHPRMQTANESLTGFPSPPQALRHSGFGTVLLPAFDSPRSPPEQPDRPAPGVRPLPPGHRQRRLDDHHLPTRSHPPTPERRLRGHRRHRLRARAIHDHGYLVSHLQQPRHSDHRLPRTHGGRHAPFLDRPLRRSTKRRPRIVASDRATPSAADPQLDYAARRERALETSPWPAPIHPSNQPPLGRIWGE